MRDRAMGVTIGPHSRHRRRPRRGATDAQLEAARREQMRAQFLLDFIEAENSSGFHAPAEAGRVLFLSLDHAHQGLRALGQRALVDELAGAPDAGGAGGADGGVAYAIDASVPLDGR